MFTDHILYTTTATIRFLSSVILNVHAFQLLVPFTACMSTYLGLRSLAYPLISKPNPAFNPALWVSCLTAHRLK